jgi:hypothetical protein
MIHVYLLIVVHDADEKKTTKVIIFSFVKIIPQKNVIIKGGKSNICHIIGDGAIRPG